MRKVIEIDGSAPLVSNASARRADPLSFSVYRDLVTDAARRIRKRPGIGSVVGLAAGAAVTAMHEYTFLNSAGVPTYFLFRATATSIQYLNAGTWTTMTFPTFSTTGTTSPSAGGLWWFENSDNRCFACNGKDDLIVFDGTSWKRAGMEGPLSPMGYALSGTYATGTITAFKGSTIITGVGATWVTGGAWNDLYIDINGIRYQINTVDTIGPDATATMKKAFKEDDATGLPYVIHTGPCSWELPPRYAYAYYNPTTGHCTNIRASSVTNENITEIIEKDQTGRALTLNNILYSPIAHANGFTRIKIFRTPKNGNILVALSTDIANSNVAGSTSFTETSSTFVDTALTKFPAQRTKLAPPPTGLAAIRFHMGRGWGVKLNRLHFSLHEAEVTGELGVPEEAWPSSYTRKVNYARSLVVMGADGGNENLVVQTARGDIATEGFDQRDVFTYRLPTRESGSHIYGAIGTEGALLALYADKRLLAFPGNRDLAVPVQDKFDAIRDSLLPSARIFRFTWQSRDYLLVTAAKASGSSANDVTYVYDFDLDRWYEWNAGFTSFTTAHDAATGALQLWASNSAGNSFQLLQSAQWRDAGADFQPTFTTAVLQPFDEHFAELEEVVLYVHDASGSWSGELRINEQAGGSGQAFTFDVARHFEQSAQGRRLIWRPAISIRRKATTFQLSGTLPATNADVYIEKIVLVFKQAEKIDASQVTA